MSAELRLSICIPTYNRSWQVTSLVEQMLSVQGAFEICVHDDGSSDDTYERLSQIKDTRLRVSKGPNGGRGQALQAAIQMAQGQFVMLFDDDDVLYPDGLRAVLTECGRLLPQNCVGWIYQLEDNKGARVGSAFPVAQANFIELRADYKVTGDKKEVVKRTALIEAVNVPGKARRVPTSLYWSRLARTGDVLCIDRVIGRKNYLEGGMSDRIRSLKSSNPYPLFLLARARILAFISGRYRSPWFLFRSLAAFLYYGVRARIQK